MSGYSLRKDRSRIIPLAGTGVPGPPLWILGLSLARTDIDEGTRDPNILSFVR